MKKLILMVLMGAAFSVSAWAEEAKSIDLKEVARVASALKTNESLVKDPQTIAAIRQFSEAINKSPELQALMKNPEGFAAVMRLAGSMKTGVPNKL